jgi:proteasome lid subunit RPN8/RPN11
MPFRLQLPETIHAALLAQAEAEQPLECCGLLAGLRTPEGLGQVVQHYPLANAAASPVLYEAEPHALLAAHRDMRRRNLELLATYHSHPASPAVPSQTDHRVWFHGEEVVCVIVTLTTCPPALRGWWMREDGGHDEAEVVVG